MQKFQFTNFEIKNFKDIYKETIAPDFRKKYNANVHEVPVLEKIVINVRVGKAKILGGSTTEKQKKPIEKLSDNLTLIAGQKPVECKATCSVSNFKIREGDIVGMKVTLRGERMYSFLEKVVMIALPRSRGFKGFKMSSIDKNGHFSMTIKSSEVFPEGEINVSYPMQITCVVKNTTKKEHTLDLLRGFYLPIYI